MRLRKATRWTCVRWTVSCALFFLPFALPAQAIEYSYLKIGSGGVSGAYYPIAEGICEVLNDGSHTHGLRCSVEATSGSVENIKTVRQFPEIAAGIVQSDALTKALNGSGPFAESGAYVNLRNLISLQQETLHVIAQPTAEVSSVMDLRNRRVNIGSKDSGSRVTAETLLRTIGVNFDELAFAGELEPFEQVSAFCNGELDVVIWMAAIPNQLATELTSRCQGVLLDIPDSIAFEMASERNSLVPHLLPGGIYPGNPQQTKSVGAFASLMVDSSMPTDKVQIIASEILKNLSSFKNKHPSLEFLQSDSLFRHASNILPHKAVIQLEDGVVD